MKTHDANGEGQPIKAEAALAIYSDLPQPEKERFMVLVLRQAQQATNARMKVDSWHDIDTAFNDLDNETLSVSDAANYLSLSVTTVRRHIKAGHLTPDQHIGRNQLIRIGQLKAFKSALKRTRG